MLPKELPADNQKFSIPPKFKLTYADFKLIYETSSYKVFEAKTQAKHMIRILDSKNEFVNKNYDSVASLFIQELLHLHYLQPDSVLIDTFEISENGKQIAYATLPYAPLSLQIDETLQVMDPEDPKAIDKLLKDVLSDIEFLWGGLKMRKIMDTLGPENICFMKEKNAYFLGNWAKIFEKSTLGNEVLATTTILSQDQLQNKLTSQKLAEEIKALAFAVLKLKNIEYGEVKSLGATSSVDPTIYDFAVRTKLSKAFKDSEQFQNQFERMLSVNPQKLPSLEELKRIKNDPKVEKKEVSIGHGFEETKYVKTDPKDTEITQAQTSIKKPIKIIGKILIIIDYLLYLGLRYSNYNILLFILIEFLFVSIY